MNVKPVFSQRNSMVIKMVKITGMGRGECEEGTPIVYVSFYNV